MGVKSPNGKPPDYASYTVGPFGTGFNDEDGIIAHLWDVTATGVRFRLYTTRYQRWCGKTGWSKTLVTAFSTSKTHTPVGLSNGDERVGFYPP